MAHDEWWTKKHLFNHLCKKYNIYPELDAFANEENKLCDAYFCKEEDPDGLTGNWQGYKAVWWNPPNSILKDCVLKAFMEWNDGATLLGIIPAGAFATWYFKDTIWESFKLLGKEHVIVEPCLPRPEFLDHGKDADNGNRNSYMEIVLR